MKLFADLLKGPNNKYWDLARIISASGMLAMLGGAGWNVALGLGIDLGPTGLGGGLAAFMTAAAALIYAKDKAGAETIKPARARRSS